MKTLKKFIVTLMIMGIVVLLSPFNIVECTTKPTITISSPPDGEYLKVQYLVTDVNNKIIEEGIFRGDGLRPATMYLECGQDADTDAIWISVDTYAYQGLSQANKETVIAVALDCIYKSDVSKTNRVKLYNFIVDTDSSTASLVRQLSSDVNADFAGAYSSFRPFSGVIGWLLGIIALGMFMMLGLTAIVDIAYINLPGVQLILGDANSKDRPKFVSLEAWNAIKESESKAGTEYKSPLGIYLKSKVGQYIAIFICLLYLASGKLYDLIANIMDYFSSLI